MAEQRAPIIGQQQLSGALQQTCIPGQEYEVMLTALPNGMEKGKLRFSVLLSPRLKPACDTQLSQFAPTFTDWPATVRSLRFDVFFDSITTPLEPEPLWSPASLDSRLWAAIFKDTTFVRRYEFDRGQHTDRNKYLPLALGERNLHRSLIKQDLYQNIALVSPAKFPTRTEFTQHLERAGVLQRVTTQVPGQIQFRVGVQNPVSELFLRVRPSLMQKELELLRQPGALQQAPGVQPRGLEGVSALSMRTVPLLRDDAHIQAATGLNVKQLDFLQFQAFAQRPAVERIIPRLRPPLPGINDWKNIIDFHQMISSLGDYPELLRRLGLRLDFLVQDPRIKSSGSFWIRPKESPPSNRFISPRTLYISTTDGGFRPQTGDPDTEIRDGLLTFGKKDQSNLPLFDVVPGDVEGAVAKIANFSQMLLEPGSTGSAPDGHGLPALRSGGLAVAHSQRDAWLEKLLGKAKDLNAQLQNEQAQNVPTGQRGRNVVLTAEHLVRGLRIDVREVRQMPNAPPQYGPWHSLCDRRGAYYLGPNLPPALDYTDEGWVAIGLTEGEGTAPAVSQRGVTPSIGMAPITGALATVGTAAITPLLLYESLFRWSGWSLCAPRPGKNIPDNKLAPLGAPIPGLNLIVAFASIPGTLPRLRFGRQYQFRARIVDLAGNSLSVRDFPNPAPELVTSDKDGYYDRFEPVSAPVVVLTQAVTGPPSTPFPLGDPLSPGESVGRLVMRTMNIERTGEPVAGPPSPVTARHIVPPKISQEMAEAHGMFDNPQTRTVRGTEAYRMMIAKDAKLSEQETKEDVHPEPSIVVPYLPDPMAAGAMFFNLPGTDQRSAFLWPQAFDGTWPDKRSFRLQIEGGTASPQFQNGVLRVFVPIGEQRTIKLSSFLLPNQELLFGIWRWIEERATPQDREALRTLVRQGQHWMITPFQELVLVHATQQPVLTPQWVSFQVARQIRPTTPTAAQIVINRSQGETTAPLLGTIALHRPSTEKFELRADWVEPIDVGMMKENVNDWLYVAGKATVFEKKVSLTPEYTGGLLSTRGLPGETVEEIGAMPFGNIPQDAQEVPPLPEEVGEVQPRGALGPGITPLIQQVPIQQTPIQKLPPAAQVQPPVEFKLPPSAVMVPTPHLPAPPPPFDESKYRCATPLPPPPPADYGERYSFAGEHRLGDTKYRCVSYTTIATTRYRDFFRPLPAEESANPPRFTRSSPVVKLDILSSVQPDAPKVLYIIPTFKWEKTPQGSRRVGGGLRVYLDRPWYSSGDGEQLAVVLYPDATAELPENVKPYVTQWGLDPLWEGSERIQSPFLQQIEPKIGVQPPPGAVMPRGGEPPPEVTPRGPLLESATQQLVRLYGIGLTLPVPANFRNAVVVRHDLGIKEVLVPRPPLVGTRAVTPSITAAAQVPLSILMPMGVTICAFDVKPDPSRQLWYCDIEMDSGNAYYPFVRLALARYQVNAIPGEHLSKVVLADFAQLLPDRSASVAFNPSNPNLVTVTLVGVPGDVGQPRTPVVEVTVEEFNPGVPGELGWTPNSQPVALPRTQANQWTGQVSLPPAGGPKQYRLVIKEYEVFQVTEPEITHQQRRLVYADVVDLRR